MTALARAIAEDCDASPVLLPPFEAQRVAIHLECGGYFPLLVSNPARALDFITAFEGRVAGIIIGGTYPNFGVEAFCTVFTNAYPNIPLLIVHLERDSANPPALVYVH